MKWPWSKKPETKDDPVWVDDILKHMMEGRKTGMGKKRKPKRKTKRKKRRKTKRKTKRRKRRRKR